MSTRTALYRDYWNAFSDVVVAYEVSPHKPLARNYRRFSFPAKSDCHLDALIQVNKDRALQVGLRMKSDDREEIFEALRERRNEIEAALGYPLIWDKKKGKKQYWIYTELVGPDPTNRDDWPKQHRWMSKTLDKFLAVFSQHIRNLGRNPSRGD